MSTAENQTLRNSLALRGSKSGIWDWNIKAGSVYFDENYFLISGYKPDEFPHAYKEWRRRVHPDDVLPVENAIKQHLAGTSNTYSVKFRFKKKTDNWMWILGQGEVVERDHEGKPVRFVGLHTDVDTRTHPTSDCQQISSAYDERVKELNCLYSISQLDVNDSLSINVFLQQVVNLIPPAWQYSENTCTHIEYLDQTIRTDNSRKTKWYQSQDIKIEGRKVGRVIVSYLEEKPEIDEGPFLKEERTLLNTIAEKIGHVLERKLMREERERQVFFNSVLLDALPHPALIIQKDRKVLAANKMAMEVGAVLGDYCWKEFGKSACLSHQDRIIASENPDTPGIKCTFCLADESLDGQLLKNDPAVNLSDRIFDTYWVAIGEDTCLHYAIDITERLNLEKQLRYAHKMEAVGTMAGGIAHDFNNMLAIISGNLDLIQHKQNKSVPAEGNIKNIRIAANRARDLVRQILTFSHHEKIELTPINLSIAVNETLGLLRSTIPSTVEITKTFNDEAVTINAESTQLQQIMINICTNAVQAMQGKGVLSVGWQEVDVLSDEVSTITNCQSGRYAKVTIGDTGTGMSQETIDKAFDPFFTTKGVGEGTGMGLSVAHGIVKQHDGFISIDSTLGHGTTFNIYFPITRNAGVWANKVTTELLPTGTERVLFVDDEEGITSTCSMLLEYRGYKVTGVTSSTEALETFRANPDEFDLVFTDQAMPKMSGAELAADLLKIRPDIPILLCSGYSATVTEQEAKAIGIREFCMKPMDMEQFAIVARKVLDESGR